MWCALTAACTAPTPPPPSPGACATNNGGCGDPRTTLCLEDAGTASCRVLSQCSLGALGCDDSNPCTTDLCDVERGCLHIPSAVACDDSDACTVDGCQVATGCTHTFVCRCAKAADCADLNPCTDDSCNAGSCVNTPNAASCNDGNACTQNDVCSGGKCGGTARVCNDDNPCTTDGCDSSAGCVTTPNTASCSDGNACTQGDVCSSGTCGGSAVSCDDNNPCTNDSCSPDAGCARVNNDAGCSDGNACTQGDVCSGGSCTGAARVCDDGNPCTADSCSAGSGCIAVFSSQICLCQPGGARCGTDAVEACNGSGTAWLHQQSCPKGCANAVCTGPCSVGAARCNQDVAETCVDADGGWAPAAPCDAGCVAGGCLVDLLVDGTTLTMEGIHTYRHLRVTDGGSIRLGASGVLELRAATIVVDPGGTINADDLGDDQRGEGYHSVQLCNPKVYGNPGSSYGTLGGSVFVACGTSGGFTVGGPASYDSVDDLSISKGSKWNTTPGGGLVRLVAEQVILNGLVTASATAGSASGGGVLIAARQSLSGNGNIRTSGGPGSPSGGHGRIKLLTPTLAASGFTGSTTGVVTENMLPPLDLSATTHPNPALWYNDSAPAAVLSWSVPFAAAGGLYFWKTSSPAPVTPNGTLGGGVPVQTETVSLPLLAVSEGTFHFNLVPVGQNNVVGTLRASVPVNVNSTPPPVTSTTHPTPSVWDNSLTPGTLVQFASVAPRGDASSTGSHFVFDRFGDTLPSKVPGTFSASRSYVFANVAAGPWALHVVDRDTRGETTRAARHYVVLVGPNPGTGTLRGTVIDGSVTPSAPLAGARVEINRGIFNALLASPVSNSSGAYTFGSNNVPASTAFASGQWEVRVTRAGYQSVTRLVSISPGATVVEDFTLFK